MKVSVYNLKQAVNVEGKWVKKDANTERVGLKLTGKQVEFHNENFKVSGSFYELNKDLDDKFQKAVKKHKKG